MALVIILRVVMVIYDLQCINGHRFEGWFPSSKDFEGQVEDGLVSCSHCGCEDVHRIPSGGHIAVSKPQVKSKKVPSNSPDRERAINYDPVIFVKAVNEYIEKNFKDVGSDFADQAVKMKRGEIPQEPIYGETTTADCDRLESEEVDYSLIPKLPEEFDN